MADLGYKSQLIADTGISMGDEGKGRLVYEIIDDLQKIEGCNDPVEMILKVNGGANSGHTAAGLKLNLLPSGVVEKSVSYLGIGMGVVADPRKLLWESVPLEKKGHVVTSRLAIDERTMFSDLTHRLLDHAWEFYRETILGNEARGSTCRGISPAYADEVSQWQVYYGDLLGSKEAFAEKLKVKWERALRTIEHVCQVSPDAWNGFFDKLSKAEMQANEQALAEGCFDESEYRFSDFKGEAPFTLNMDALVDVYWEVGQKFKDQICDLREKVIDIIRRKKYIIGEFGQSYWLDKRHGFSPNVTASHTFTPEFFQSAGIPVGPLHNVGACKAYDTKVGTHVFLTQIDDESPIAPILKKLEFGTSTGRQRMIGWFDAVEKGDTLRFGGYDDLVINKLDVLKNQGDWKGPLLVCTSYTDEEGNEYNYVPRNDDLRKSLKPVYESYDTWDEDISEIRDFKDLPLNAKKYVAGMVKAVLNVANRGNDYQQFTFNLRYIGVGPDRGQLIRGIPSLNEVCEL